jgi:hypothetical protein
VANFPGGGQLPGDLLYVKGYVKERVDWFAAGKRWKNWKEDVATLGDKLAAKHWPDLVDKD